MRFTIQNHQYLRWKPSVTHLKSQRIYILRIPVEFLLRTLIIMDNCFYFIDWETKGVKWFICIHIVGKQTNSQVTWLLLYLYCMIPNHLLNHYSKTCIFKLLFCNYALIISTIENYSSMYKMNSYICLKSKLTYLLRIFEVQPSRVLNLVKVMHNLFIFYFT